MDDNTLPHCDELFKRYLDPWYEEPIRQWKGVEATRPDLINLEQFRGQPGAAVSPLTTEGQRQVEEIIRHIESITATEWTDRAGGTLPNWTDVLQFLDERFDRQFIGQTILASDPSTPKNPYVFCCTEFGMVIALNLRAKYPELEWVYAWPHWETAFFHSYTGIYIPVFHWAIKKMSEYGVDDGFVAKVGACCQVLDQHSKV
jgi:hypothetical protein